MSFLSRATQGIIDQAYAVVMYAFDGIGKSTWASQAPHPIFIGVESGTSQLDVARFPQPKTFDDVLLMLDELATSEHEYKTVVLDSIDWLEPLIWEKVCKEYKVANIEKVEGGYSKGYIVALKEWKLLIEKLEVLRSFKKMNYILIAHAESKKFNDVENNVEYDRVQLKLHHKAASLVREAVDAVLYATFEVSTVKDDKKKTRAYGDGTRVVYTERRPGYDAKNRYGLRHTLPLDWEEFEAAARKGEPESAEAIRNRITGMLSTLHNQELAEKVTATVEKAGEDAKRLALIENKIKIRIGEQDDA